MLAIGGNSDEGKDGRVAHQDALRTIRVERWRLGTFFNKLPKAAGDFVRGRRPIAQLFDESFFIDALSIDATRFTALEYRCQVVLGAEQAGEVGARNALENECDGPRSEEPIDLQIDVFLARPVQCAVPGRIDLVRAHFALRIFAVGNDSSVGKRPFYQAVQSFRANEVLYREEPDAVMRVEKIEVGRGIGRVLQLLGPLREQLAVGLLKRKQDQRREGKVVDHLCFIGSLAEVGDELFMGHVCLGN